MTRKLILWKIYKGDVLASSMPACVKTTNWNLITAVGVWVFPPIEWQSIHNLQHFEAKSNY